MYQNRESSHGWLIKGLANILFEAHSTMTTTSLPYSIVDAFATGPFTGNPAAVLVLSTPLPDALMQKIAA